MILNSPYISGSLTVTGNIITSGSITISGSIASASYAVSASEASKLQGLGSSSFAPAATFNTVSQSYAASSASLSTRVTNEEATSSVLTSASSSFAIVSSSYATASGSLSTRVTNLEVTTSVVSSSFATTSGSLSSRVTIIEGQDATTGSNNFTGVQYVSNTSNAISFTSTASLYTDGGFRVAKDSFVSGTAYFNNITVYGTSSIQYITSSQVNIGSNIITVNTDTPAVRFGGLAVFDSGSTQLTGSLFWDSEKNHWIYSNPSGSTYNSAMLMNGPRNTGSLGDEQGTTNNALMKGQGGDHITSSQMIDDGTTVQIPGNLQVTGSLSGSSALYSSTVTATGLVSSFTSNANSNNGLNIVNSGTVGYGGAVTFNIGSGGINYNSARIYSENEGTGGTFRIQTANTSQVLSDRLTISNTGAATFSSSVSTGAALTVTGTNSTSANNTITGYSADLYALAIRQKGASAGISGTNFMAQIISATGAEGLEIYTPNSKELIFGTNATERLRITSAGLVGIGTSSPSGLLQVGVANAGIYFDVTTQYTPKIKAAGTISDLQIESVGSGGNMILGAPGATSVMQFFVNGTLGTGERMRITSGGNVGIGTSSPYGKFQVYSVATSPSLTVGTAAAAIISCAEGQELAITANGTAPYGINFQARNNNGGGPSGTSYPIVFNPLGGNVGIGTSSPSGTDVTLNVRGISGKTVGMVVAESYDAGSMVSLYSGSSSGDDPSLIYLKNLRFGSGNKDTSSYVERMRITSGGNVGIGTSTVTTFSTNYIALNINAPTGYGSGTIFKINDVAETNFYAESGLTTLNIAGAYTITGGFGTAQKVLSTGYIYWGALPSVLTYMKYNFNVGADLNIGFRNNSGVATLETMNDGVSANTPMQFAATRYTFASGGNVLIGTTTDAGYKLQVSGTARFYDDNGITLYSPSWSFYRQIYPYNGDLYFSNGTNQGYLNSAGAWINASDISIKKDVTEIKYGLNEVLNLKPCSYKMKENNLEQIGFIAQEVEKILPELVQTDNKEMKGLSYGNLTAVLVKAIQEQQLQIQALKTRIETLEK
jgi:hypothetical protein